MKPPAIRRLHVPNSLAEALSLHSSYGKQSEYFAGGTWIMRANLREDFEPRAYISLVGLTELREISVSPNAVSIGSLATHSSISEAIRDISELKALHAASSKSANPAIRNMATIGGNICTVGFAAADLIPALICLSASVEIVSEDGRQQVSIESFLSGREMFRGLVTRILLPRENRNSAHARLPLKKAGDYPAAIVSVSAEINARGSLTNPIIAVGSVETTARRWRSLEEKLHAKNAAFGEVAKIANECLEEFSARDGIDAPGWYRKRVLPELVRRAFIDLAFHKVEEQK